MKKVIIFYLFFVLDLFQLQAQVNIVANPSFEDTVRCPQHTGEMIIPSACKNWYDPNASSSDYFNSCAFVQNDANVPNVLFGWQFARTGSAFAGFATYDGREYIQEKLDSALIQNHIYCIKFYVSLANIVNIASNNIGMFISDSIPLPPSSVGTYINCIPQVNDTIPIIDTANWTKISGEYLAHGGEQYITIGNFYTDVQTDTVHLSHQNISLNAYYYIDDVSIIDCGVGMNELAKNSNYKLYPNPNSGTMTLEYHLEGNETGEIEIYDLAGKLISSNVFNSSSTTLLVNENNLDAGAYYYCIKVNGNKVKTDKLIIIK